MSNRPAWCCGACPAIVGAGYDCTCRGNPRCPKRIRVVPVRANGRIREWAIQRGGFDLGFSATHERAMYLAQKVARGATQA